LQTRLRYEFGCGEQPEPIMSFPCFFQRNIVLADEIGATFRRLCFFNI
jgi:hypothetical protein